MNLYMKEQYWTKEKQTVDALPAQTSLKYMYK